MLSEPESVSVKLVVQQWTLSPVSQRLQEKSKLRCLSLPLLLKVLDLLHCSQYLKTKKKKL